MADRRREPGSSNERSDENHRSVSITEASDGFVVDVEVDWKDATEETDGTDLEQVPDGDRTEGTDVRDPGQEAEAEPAGSADGLPSRLVVDGSDTHDDATYTVSVSGSIRPDSDASSAAEAVEQPGSPTNGRVVGIVDGDTHVYRYSGVIEEVSVNGHVDIRFGGEQP
ncbi:hypothetical protein [Haloarchaeobius baliensis]|uniref:hypothetical protein n=1 Tax=Haloarchaeobius baliensis TaxID=1670458 RepID=UPI003F881E22